MDTQALIELQSTPRHGGGRHAGPTFTVVLVMSFLALSACAAFAVIMSNGPSSPGGPQAAAAPLLTSAADASIGPAEPSGSPALAFTASPLEDDVAIGESGSLVVTVANTTDVAVLMESIDVEVLQPSAPDCRPEWFAVQGYSAADDAPITVPAGDSARVRLSYTMVDLVETNQDACKGVTLPLTITGSGRPV